MSDLHPIDDQLDLYNMRILAARVGWPAGRLRVCERLRRELPGWTVYWSSRLPARTGYFALRDHPDWGEPPAYGETPETLRRVVWAWPHPRQRRVPAGFTPLPRSAR